MRPSGATALCSNGIAGRPGGFTVEEIKATYASVSSQSVYDELCADPTQRDLAAASTSVRRTGRTALATSITGRA